MKRNCTLFLQAFAYFFLFVGSSRAAAINYGAFAGANVIYVDVTESSSTSGLPLYGAPQVAGNVLDFDPVTYSAAAQSGTAVVTDGQLVFDLHGLAGAAINKLNFQEGGDLSVAGVGTNSTFVDVSAAVQLSVREIDGIAISPILIPSSLTFSPHANGTWQLGSDGSAIALGWSGAATVDLNQELNNRGISFTGGATRLVVSVDNALAALTEATSLASISKKDFKVSPTVSGGVPGGTAQNPLLPDSSGPGGAFAFNIDAADLTVGNNGLWIDPPLATGYRYQITGGQFIGVAPPDDPNVVNDDDNSYLLSSANGSFTLNPSLGFPASEHNFVTHGGAVNQFTIQGISVGGVGLDPSNSAAFPSFLRLSLGGGPATITMTPIPEPSALLLLATAAMTFGLPLHYCRRHRQAVRA